MSLMEEWGNCGLCEYVPSTESGVTLGECKENIVDVRGKMGRKSKVLEKEEEQGRNWWTKSQLNHKCQTNTQPTTICYCPTLFFKRKWVPTFKNQETLYINLWIPYLFLKREKEQSLANICYNIVMAISSGWSMHATLCHSPHHTLLPDIQLLHRFTGPFVTTTSEIAMHIGPVISAILLSTIFQRVKWNT